MNGTARLLESMCADVLRDGNIGAERKPEKEAHDKPDDRHVVADGRHRLRSDETSEHRDVRRIEHLLQNSRQSDGQGKDDDLIPQRTFKHIDFSSMNPQQKTSFFPSNFSVNHHSAPYIVKSPSSDHESETPGDSFYQCADCTNRP